MPFARGPIVDVNSAVESPNPDNADKLQFKDDAGVCHKFIPREVKCPSDKSKIRTYPISVKK